MAEFKRLATLQVSLDNSPTLLNIVTVQRLHYIILEF